MGFPTRTLRGTFGPTLVNERPVKDPRKEIADTTFNELFWQVGGMGRTVPWAEIHCKVMSGAITVVHQRLAFDPDQALANVTITRDGPGRYSIAFAAQYPNEVGTLKNCVINAGAVLTERQCEHTGTHDGGMGNASLVDSTASFNVDEFNDIAYVHNLTDGSSAVVTDTAATEIFGVLAGGTGNVWDTGDEYIVQRFPLSGDVVGTANNTAKFYFVNEGTFIDPAYFILLLW